jgi:uncharacterized repeat protein (TIGR01451 family)
VSVSGAFGRSTTSPGTCPTTPTFALAANGASCTVGVQFNPVQTGAANGSVTVTAPGFTVGGSPVALSGNGVPRSADLSITKTDNRTVVSAGAAVSYSIVVSNPATAGAGAGQSNTAVTGATVTDALPATLAGASWTCVATSGSSCAAASGSGNLNTTVNLVQGGSATYTVNATVSATAPGGSSVVNTATVTAPAGVVDPNSANNSASDSDFVAPALPTIGTIDNFNRANATNLGTSWFQGLLLGSAAIRVNANEAFGNSAGQASWNVTTFGQKQGAGFAFAQDAGSPAAPLNASSLLLKVSNGGGGNANPANYVRVRYNSSQVIVETTNNGNALGPTYTTLATFNSGAFATGDTLTAVANADGSVDVWRNSTYLGRSATSTFTGTGRVGLDLPANARVDDFRGGTVP